MNVDFSYVIKGINYKIEVILMSETLEEFNYYYASAMGYISACFDLGHINLSVLGYFQNAIFDLVYREDGIGVTGVLFVDDLKLINDRYLSLYNKLYES